MKNNWKIKAVLYFFLLSFIILFLLSDFMLGILINNTVALYFVQTYRWAFFVVILSLILYFLLRKPFLLYKELSLKHEISKKNYRLVVDHLKEDYFFYRHQVDKPFVYLSSSVFNMLGYSRGEFEKVYGKVGGAILVDDCFERHRKLAMNDLRQPNFEVAIRAKSGQVFTIEVREIPVTDETGKLIAIEGIAKNISRYKHVENELLEKENKYHTLFESANDGFFIMLDDKFIDCNRRILEIFQCTVEDVIMHTPFGFRFSPPVQLDGRNSREKAMELIRMAYTGEPQNFEWTHLRSGASPFQCEVNLSKFTFGEKDYLLAVIRDITEKKEAEKSRLENEEKFRLIFENSPFGIIHFNKDGVVTACNDRHLEILQADRANLIGLNLLNDLSDQGMKDTVRICIEGKKTFYEGPYDPVTGSRKVSIKATFTPMVQKGTTIGGFGIIEETTQHLEMAIKCEKNETDLREIMENSRQILYKLDVKQGNYVYMSSAVEDILGYKPEEFYIRTATQIREMLHPEDIGKAKDIVAKMICSMPATKADFSIEYRFMHKNGSFKWISDKYHIHSDPDGTPLYIIGNVTDITELKEAEEALKKFRYGNSAV